MDFFFCFDVVIVDDGTPVIFIGIAQKVDKMEIQLCVIT